MEFRPERFTEEESKGRPSSAYMPFGIGPRMCLGNRFSILEQKIFMTHLLLKYKIELPDPNVVIKPLTSNFTLTPPHDLKVIFKKR
jgi:cytochrome P450